MSLATALFLVPNKPRTGVLVSLSHPLLTQASTQLYTFSGFGLTPKFPLPPFSAWLWSGDLSDCSDLQGFGGCGGSRGLQGPPGASGGLRRPPAASGAPGLVVLLGRCGALGDVGFRSGFRVLFGPALPAASAGLQGFPGASGGLRGPGALGVKIW